MLTYSLASNAAPRVNFDDVYARAFNDSRPGAGVKLLRSDSRFENGLRTQHGLPDIAIMRLFLRDSMILPRSTSSPPQ
jgi:hypothetical protein